VKLISLLSGSTMKLNPKVRFGIERKTKITTINATTLNKILNKWLNFFDTIVTVSLRMAWQSLLQDAGYLIVIAYLPTVTVGPEDTLFYITISKVFIASIYVF
jgi:hypothetical protein